MSKDELLRHIKKELELGSTKEKISAYLAVGGWKPEDIEKAFNEIKKSNKDRYFTPTEFASFQKTKFRQVIDVTLGTILSLLVGFLILAYIVGGQS